VGRVNGRLLLKGCFSLKTRRAMRRNKERPSESSAIIRIGYILFLQSRECGDYRTAMLTDAEGLTVGPGG
jgi:hypothetical protein